MYVSERAKPVYVQYILVEKSFHAYLQSAVRMSAIVNFVGV